jgi:8-oxo-dGTP diphosphatase
MGKKPEIRVAAAILFNGPAVLIARRPPGDALAGKWEFPGGKVENGETPEQCLVREMEEEFGIGVEVGDFWGATLYADPHKSIRLLSYEVFWKQGPMVAACHSAWRFVLPQDLAGYDLAPADRPIAAMIEARARASITGAITNTRNPSGC